MTKILFVCHGRELTDPVLPRFTTKNHGTIRVLLPIYY